MREDDTTLAKDIKFLEKAFKKWTPNILASPYIPTPTILVRPIDVNNGSGKRGRKFKPSPTTKPSKKYPQKKYEDIIDNLHKGALAYSVGDYGTAINCFTKLLEKDWLKYSSYFYLIKTLIKLDIEKEIISLKQNVNNNDIKMKKSSKNEE